MFFENEDLYLALMTWKEPDWKGFDPMDSETWWKGILKELQGEPREKLAWVTGFGVDGEPFYHDPGVGHGGPITGGRTSADWNVMEWLPSGLSSKDTNDMALEALRGGAQSLALPMGEVESLAGLLEGVYPDIAPIFWTWDARSAMADHLEALSAWSAHGRTYEPGADMQGGFLDKLPLSVERRARELFPRFFFAFSALPPASDSADSLTEALKEAHGAVSRTGTAQGHLIRMEIGNDFLPEIVRLRAWRLLWGHLMASFGFPEDVPCRVVAVVSPDPALPWENTYIAAATRALSAVLGGVDHLAILPPQAPDPTLARRVARNVQHLMKEEGRLHLVADPMAGSHAVERLTQALAEQVWDAFHP